MKHIIIYLIVGLASIAAVITTAHGASIPATGQTECYDNTKEIPCPETGESFSGQDARYSTGQRSYTKLDINGKELPDNTTTWAMVRDKVTGLFWEAKNNKDRSTDYTNPRDADNTYTWYDSNQASNNGNAGTQGEGTDTEDFINALNNSRFGGFSDWRLPTARELSYLADRGKAKSPSINTTYFPETLSQYWTATTDPSNNQQSAAIDFSNSGYMNFPEKSDRNSVRAVRGEKAVQSFVDNGDGTVTDTGTGLTWQKDSLSNISWKDALAYCENLTLGGYSDWRLPNINELISLVDYSTFSPSIDTRYFTNTAYHYWSSTTCALSPYKAFHDCFYRGRVETYNKLDNGDLSHVRAVRSGESVHPVTTTTTVPSTTTTMPGTSCVVDKLYGESSEEAELLRQYRDNVLSTSPEGLQIIRIYYSWSPAIIVLLDNNSTLESLLKSIMDRWIPVAQQQVNKQKP